MTQKKTLPPREKELQTLLADPAARKQLQVLDFRYGRASGRMRPSGASLITYILVYERERGLIAG